MVTHGGVIGAVERHLGEDGPGSCPTSGGRRWSAGRDGAWSLGGRVLLLEDVEVTTPGRSDASAEGAQRGVNCLLPRRSEPRCPTEPELEAEQAYLDAVYAALEAMPGRASASRRPTRRAAGGTHQARLERDSGRGTTHRRLAALDIGDTPALLRSHRPGATGEGGRRRRLLRRASRVDDEEHTPLVVDWRAPVAEPFYRATAVEPMGVVRRRHFSAGTAARSSASTTRCSTPAPRRSGLTVVGEGALLAALERNRTGRMGDIVATIQAEQDEAIRADLAGLAHRRRRSRHRQDRGRPAPRRVSPLHVPRRLGAQGVLLVGPSPVFLRYIEQVLPSLGEHEVQLATIAGLKPGVRAARRRADADAPR